MCSKTVRLAARAGLEPAHQDRNDLSLTPWVPRLLSCRLPRMMPLTIAGIVRTSSLLMECINLLQSEDAPTLSKHIDTFLYQPVDHKAEVIGHRLNNSGTGFIPHAEIPRSSRRSYGVNLGGSFHISKKAIAEMLRRESGHMVNITSSLLSEQPLKSLPAALTTITKGGLNAVKRSLAIEHVDKGIRVNAEAPDTIPITLHAWICMLFSRPWIQWEASAKFTRS